MKSKFVTLLLASTVALGTGFSGPVLANDHARGNHGHYSQVHHDHGRHHGHYRHHNPYKHHEGYDGFGDRNRHYHHHHHDHDDDDDILGALAAGAVIGAIIDNSAHNGN